MTVRVTYHCRQRVLRKHVSQNGTAIKRIYTKPLLEQRTAFVSESPVTFVQSFNCLWNARRSFDFLANHPRPCPTRYVQRVSTSFDLKKDCTRRAQTGNAANVRSI